MTDTSQSRNADSGDGRSYKLWSFLERMNATWDDIENPREGDIGRIVRSTGLIVLFVDQIENGGLAKWYTNPTGRYADEAVSTITSLGAEETAALANHFLSSLRRHDQGSQDDRRGAVFALLDGRPEFESSLSDSIGTTFDELVRLADYWLSTELNQLSPIAGPPASNG